ncbi:MAG: TetR/AcrR family transcriptional regulator [Solirubrobacteraceae bacterium]|nr:TetR/AcrR family transcriptional regulator [Solirubrobacteraceae bacterium]
MPETKASSPLRADARRNRDALLAAARDVFASEGLDAPLDAIAKEAGVGRATLYRRFPTRDTLIAAIFEDDFDALEAAASGAEDPSRALFAILDTAFEMQRHNLGFTELFTRRPPAEDVLLNIGQRFNEVVDPALAAAQDAGHVRPDITTAEIGTVMLMMGVATANMRLHEDGEARRQRTINLLLDALDPARAPRELDA